MKKLKKGDTLIEVMFAVSVFAAIMIGGLALMNSGLARTQGTLQLSMARNAIDSQAEALRYLNAVHVANHPNNTGLSAVWNDITSERNIVGEASNLQTCNIPDSAFVIDTLNVVRRPRESINVASTYPRLIYSNSEGANDDTNAINIDRRNFNSAEGLWIEAVRGDGFYDFHIRACWNAPGSNVPMTLGTIVRLYAPNSLRRIEFFGKFFVDASAGDI